MRVPLGARVANKSDTAITAAMANATVVKKPNVFWPLTRDEYMAAEDGRMRT